MNQSKSMVKSLILILTLGVAMTMLFIASPVHIHAAAFDAQGSQQVAQSSQYHRIYHIAKSKLGDAYAYGATGPKHFDCSGFTRYIYRHGINKQLPRTAQAQYNSARHVSRARRRSGDLVFFGASRRAISHVGMYVGSGRMIDAQNRGVVVEKVSAPWWHAVGYARPANL